MKKIMTEAMASFCVNYIRREFEHNDDGSQVAYFELLSDSSLHKEMRRAFAKRKTWARNDYVRFCEQLDEVEE